MMNQTLLAPDQARQVTRNHAINAPAWDLVGSSAWGGVVDVAAWRGLRDHQAFDCCPVPATAFLALALQVGRNRLGGASPVVGQFAMHRPLILAAHSPLPEWRILSQAGAPDCIEVACGTRIAQDHAILASAVFESPSIPVGGHGSWRNDRLGNDIPEVDVADYYLRMRTAGLQYGPRFRTIKRLWSGDDEAFALVECCAHDETDHAGVMSPELLDGCIQVCGAGNSVKAEGQAYLPIAVERCSIVRTVSSAWVHAQTKPAPNGDLLCQIDVWDVDGSKIGMISGLRLRRAKTATWARIIRGVQPKPVARIVSPSRSLVSHRLKMPGSKGILNRLAWQPFIRQAPDPGQVEIEVRAAALNFRDVLAVLGRYPGPAFALGAECAGVVVRLGDGVSAFNVGDEVLAICEGSFAGHVLADADMVAHKPTLLAFEDAAALPVAFLTAHYGLAVLGRLAAGERVLIHAASGGVGMAALQIARRLGADIYATASLPKWAALQHLGILQLADSRDPDFARTIRAHCRHGGMDVILNFLTGEFVWNGLDLLNAGGRFIEIGKHSLLTEKERATVKPEVEYHAFDLGEMVKDCKSTVGIMLRDLVKHVDGGSYSTTAQHVFAEQDAPEAFRLMAKARHIGKVVLEIGRQT